MDPVTRIAVQPHTLANFNEKTWLPMTIHARKISYHQVQLPTPASNVYYVCSC